MYVVRLPVFEGPFDLLLQLIERERLDISVISLALVTDQFLAHVAGFEDTIKAGELANFLVIAARLILIKSRLLLPQPARGDAEEEEEDPAEALARQLRDYKRFKEAALALHTIEQSGYHAYTRAAPPPELERRLKADGMSLAELLAAAQSAFAALPETAVPQGVVVPFTLTIHDQIQLIRRATTGDRPVTFRALIQHATHRLEIIVTLLAVLELIKRRQVLVAQSGLFGEIEVTPMPGVEITDEEAENGGEGT